MTTHAQPPAATAPQQAPDSAVQRKASPIKWWAATGVLVLAVTAYEWITWYVSGHAVPTPAGPDQVPGWQEVTARIWEAGTVVAAILAISYFVIRPWRRDRRLSSDAILMIGWFSVWALQDSWLNYSGQWFNYNSAFVNLGCPQCEIPGWQGPHPERMAEPYLWLFGVYVGILFSLTVACCQVMSWAKRRWPGIGTAGLIGIALGTMMVVDFLMEAVFLRFGLFHYGGSISWLTVFHGETYQFPIYEAVFYGGFLGACSCVRFFKDDKGFTVAERGAARLHVTPKARTFVRIIATIGFLNALYFAEFMVPIQWFAAHADTYPDSILHKSYLTNMQCGPATDVACPDRRLPLLNGPDSARITPEGTLLAPKGVPTQTNG